MKQLKNFKLRYENVQFNKNKVVKRLIRDQNREADWLIIKDVVKWVCCIATKTLGTVVSELHLRRVFNFKKAYRSLDHPLTIKDVLLIVLSLLLLWALFVKDHKAIAENPPLKTTQKPTPPKIKPTKLKKAKEVHIATPKPKVVSTPSVSVKRANCSAYGAAAEELIRRESGCNPLARNPSSGACGIAQELPCGKSGCKWGDGACQLRWMRNYVVGRYGSWENALAFHSRNNWY